MIFSQHFPFWLLMSNTQLRTAQAGVGSAATAPTPAPAPALAPAPSALVAIRSTYVLSSALSRQIYNNPPQSAAGGCIEDGPTPQPLLQPQPSLQRRAAASVYSPHNVFNPEAAAHVHSIGSQILTCPTVFSPAEDACNRVRAVADILSHIEGSLRTKGPLRQNSKLAADYLFNSPVVMKTSYVTAVTSRVKPLNLGFLKSDNNRQPATIGLYARNCSQPRAFKAFSWPSFKLMRRKYLEGRSNGEAQIVLNPSTLKCKSNLEQMETTTSETANLNIPINTPSPCHLHLEVPSIAKVKRVRVHKRRISKPASYELNSNTRDRHGNLMCPHNIRKYYCALCGGRGMCHHNRQRAQCKDCNLGYDGKRKTQRKRKVSQKQANLTEAEAPIECNMQ